MIMKERIGGNMGNILERYKIEIENTSLNHEDYTIKYQELEDGSSLTCLCNNNMYFSRYYESCGYDLNKRSICTQIRFFISHFIKDEVDKEEVYKMYIERLGIDYELHHVDFEYIPECEWLGLLPDSEESFSMWSRVGDSELRLENWVIYIRHNKTYAKYVMTGEDKCLFDFALLNTHVSDMEEVKEYLLETLALPTMYSMYLEVIKKKKEKKGRKRLNVFK